jgi:hypothetical protein
LAIDSGEHIVTFAPQRVRHQIQQIDIVVDDKYFHPGFLLFG